MDSASQTDPSRKPRLGRISLPSPRADGAPLIPPGHDPGGGESADSDVQPPGPGRCMIEPGGRDRVTGSVGAGRPPS